MKRRTFLKSAVAVPMMVIPASPTGVVGAIQPGRITCVNFPPGPQKTPVLLELASQICRRYPTDVILSGTDGSVVDVRCATGDRVHSVASSEIDRVAAYDFAIRLQRKSLLGYSLLILGEWSTFIDHARPFRIPATGGIPQRVQFQLWAAGLRLAIGFGVTAATRRCVGCDSGCRRQTLLSPNGRMRGAYGRSG